MRNVYERLRTSVVGDVGRAAWRSRAVSRTRHTVLREARNIQLKDSRTGRRAFIIGHGHSILGQDLTRLNEEVVFCLNSFFYHEQFHEIAPDFLCSLDTDLLDPAHRRAWYEMHLKHRTEGVTKLFSIRARRIDRKYGLFQDHPVYYLYAGSEAVPRMWEYQGAFPVDLTRPTPIGGIVAFDVAIPAALYAGCTEIVLIGFDGGKIETLDDFVNYNFYGKDPLITMETYEAQFAQFFGPVAAGRDQERAGHWERIIANVHSTMAEHGARIVNATPVGDTFPGIPRVSFDDLF
jgi:hypothetical protein